QRRQGGGRPDVAGLYGFRSLRQRPLSAVSVSRYIRNSPPFVTASSRTGPAMKTYRIAIVGIGKITEDQHLPVIAKNPRFELAALVSQRGIGRAGVPSFKTTEEMLAALPDVEAVSICTPPNVRHGITRTVLDAGRDVLLEKPTTATTSELTDLIAH